MIFGADNAVTNTVVHFCARWLPAVDAQVSKSEMGILHKPSSTEQLVDMRPEIQSIQLPISIVIQSQFTPYFVPLQVPACLLTYMMPMD